MNQPDQPSSIQTAALIVQALVSCGVRKVAYCSGSRNAPFAYALAALEDAGQVRCYTFAEERGAGFWAIGALQGEGADTTSVAVITTSGTAVAELHPAIEEAKYLGLPLVVVTADRPFELRGVGANQTTEQTAFFGGSVVANLEIPAIDDIAGPATQRALVGRVQRLAARATGFGGLPGPVHLNVCLREPLAPTVSTGPSADAARAAQWDELTPGGPFPRRDRVGGTRWSDVVDPSLRTLVVAGDGPGKHADSAMRRVAEYAAELGVPLIAEPSSGLCDLASWLPHGPLVAERLLRDFRAEQATEEGAQVAEGAGNPKMASALGGGDGVDPQSSESAVPAVQQVVVLGRPTLSRQVDRLLAALGTGRTRKVVVSRSERWQDISGTASEVVTELLPDDSDPAPAALQAERRAWQQQCRQISADVEAIVRSESRGLNHLGAARMIWRHSRDINLWLAASNVIRSFDLGAAAPGARDVYSNRGLAGIDGTIASSLGLQAATGKPVRVVLGDLSFCYDLASLPARPGGEQDVQLIVFDDQGGSIFHSLEHGAATDRDTYLKFFGVPQHIDICAVAGACGWEPRSVRSIEELREVVLQPVRGRSLVHVPLPLPTEQFATVRSLSAQP